MRQSISKIKKIGFHAVIFFVVFLIMLKLFGVPLGWLFGHLIPLSSIPTGRNMNVEITWDTLLFIGQNVKVFVIDSENRSPIQDAKVTISKDGSKITDLSTDENGLAYLEYPGETTIVEVNKEGYHPVMKVVPHVPSKWYADIVNSIIGGVIANLITYPLFKRIRKAKTKS